MVFPSNNPMIRSLKKSHAIHLKELIKIQSKSSFNTCYGCIIDAGSSGSRIYIYNWDCRTRQTFPKIKVEETTPNFRKSGGIAKLNKPYNINVPEYLSELVNYAKSIVPSNQTMYTPIVFSGTAGMRLLSKEDQSEILNVVSNALSNSSFHFENSNKLSFAQVISGVHEGVFGWLTTNYVKNLISPSIGPSKTTAVLDLGGASFQITFHPETVPTSDIFEMELSGIVNYTLYSHSFLGYGNDEARNAVLRLIGESVPGTIISPCFNSGFNETGALASNASTRVVGSGNPDACRVFIRQFLNVTKPYSGNTINGVYFPQIPSDMEFLGMSSVGYLVDYLGLNSTLSIGDLLASGNELCSKNYSNLTFNSYKQTYCFLAMYSYELLSTAFGLPDNKFITATNSINGFGITYAFGNLMYQVSQLPCNLNFENCAVDTTSKTNTSNTYFMNCVLLISSLHLFLLLL